MPQNCNVCGNKLFSRFSQVIDPITNERFAIYRCSICNLGHTIPHPEELNHYYGPVYYGKRHSFTSKYCTKRRLGFLSNSTASPTCDYSHTDKRLLDIGCGDGSFLIAAKNEGWNVMGTEIAPNASRSLGLDVRESIEQIFSETSDSLFDCITMWHSLEHINDIKTTLSQLSRLLKPDGKLIIAVPDNGSLQALFFKSRWLHLDVPRHLYHFDGASLSSCLNNAGFTIQHQWHQELEYDLMGWAQSALNCFFPVPNIFLDSLTGKGKGDRRILNISSFVFGVIMTALFLPMVVIEKLLRRGATLILVARRCQ